MPESDPPFRPGVGAIFEVVARLRAPDGCPWDREQTHESLRPYLLEETYEVLEAIDRGDDSKLREELGDLLLQVAMHAEIAAQEGRFDGAAVSETVADKMVRRHPHVFGEVEVADADHVLRNWERQKAHEASAAGRPDESVLARVPRTLPALAWSLALQKRAARVGFDFESAGDAVGKVAEEAGELAAVEDPSRAFDELGDLLFALVSLARKLKVNPEDALRASGQRFAARFAALEKRLRDEGHELRDLPAAELARLWSETR